MSNLDLAQILKDEIQTQHEIISKATRRHRILSHYATLLRLGVPAKVVAAEIEAAGEDVPNLAEWMKTHR